MALVSMEDGTASCACLPALGGYGVNSPAKCEDCATKQRTIGAPSPLPETRPSAPVLSRSLQTLTSFPGDFRALKALIAAQYNGVEIAKPHFELNKDNLKPEFLAKNPTGKVPLLETPHGTCCVRRGEGALRCLAACHALPSSRCHLI